jgi:hypothetical protein
MTQLKANANDPFQHGDTLTEHDADRSSGAAFYIGVLGYLAAIPLSVLTLSLMGAF